MRKPNFIQKKEMSPTTKALSALLCVSVFALYASSHSVQKYVKTLVVKTNKVETAQVTLPAEQPVHEPVSVAPTMPVAQAREPSAIEEKPEVLTATDELTNLEARFQSQSIVGLDSLEREKDSKAILITLNSDVFFPLGTAKLGPTSANSIQQIVDLLKPLSSTSIIEIEGHTDDSPIVHQRVNYPSNWELSAARAASFIPYFSNNGFFKEQLKVIGYGDSRPVFSSPITGMTSARNRRIVLRVFTGG